MGHARGQEVTPLYVGLSTLARTFGISVNSLRRLIGCGRLNGDTGLRRIGHHYRVELAAFKRAVDNGEFSE